MDIHSPRYPISPLIFREMPQQQPQTFSSSSIKTCEVVLFLLLTMFSTAEASCKAIKDIKSVSYSTMNLLDSENTSFQILYQKSKQVSSDTILERIAPCNVNETGIDPGKLSLYASCLCGYGEPDSEYASEIDIYWGNQGGETASCLKSRLDKICYSKTDTIVIITVFSVMGLGAVCALGYGMCWQKEARSRARRPEGTPLIETGF